MPLEVQGSKVKVGKNERREEEREAARDKLPKIKVFYVAAARAQPALLPITLCWHTNPTPLSPQGKCCSLGLADTQLSSCHPLPDMVLHTNNKLWLLIHYAKSAQASSSCKKVRSCLQPTAQATSQSCFPQEHTSNKRGRPPCSEWPQCHGCQLPHPCYPWAALVFPKLLGSLST